MIPTRRDHFGGKPCISIDNGELFYIGGKRQLRRVIKDEEEKRHILESCHAETGGTALH